MHYGSVGVGIFAPVAFGLNVTVIKCLFGMRLVAIAKQHFELKRENPIVNLNGDNHFKSTRPVGTKWTLCLFSKKSFNKDDRMNKILQNTISSTSKRKTSFKGLGIPSLEEEFAKEVKSCLPTKYDAASLMAIGLSL